MVLLAALACASPAVAVESVLYAFKGGADGANPSAGLVRDNQGAFYGATVYGGASGFGTVFKLTPPVAPATTWTKTTIYSFAAADGRNSYSDLVIDPAGALYGTTLLGGASGKGTVFKLSPPVAPASAWTHTILHSFPGGAGGANPHSGLVFDIGTGALFGTANGGPAGAGVVYRLAPTGSCNGPVTYTASVIYAFKGAGDGAAPIGGLAIDGGGALYGATYLGGSGFGTVFKLTPPVGSATVWTKALLHRFAGGSAGANPYAGVIVDSHRAVYGATRSGGAFGRGAIFRLTPPDPPATLWTKTTISSFGPWPDGASPDASLVLDSSNGALYGSTRAGGSADKGSIFKLTRPVVPATVWTRTIMHSFKAAPDGANPAASLIIGDSGILYSANGILYGTAQNGGAGYGVVFQVK